MNDFASPAAPRACFERYLKPNEVRTLLATIAKFADVSAARDHCWIRVGMHGGFRVGTLRQLTRGDARAMLRAKRTMLRPEITKGRRGLNAPMGPRLERALRDALALHKRMNLPDDDALPLFVSRRGGFMSERAFQERLQHWREEAGITVDVSPHWLRHTMAKTVQHHTTARDPQGVVQTLLGHADRRSTGIYTLPDRSDLEQAVEAAC